MPQVYEPIPELLAARIADAVLERNVNDRLQTARALLAWAVTLVRDSDAETRLDLARSCFCNAVWLAGPNEKFDEAAVKIVREPLDAARHC